MKVYRIEISRPDGRDRKEYARLNCEEADEEAFSAQTGKDTLCTAWKELELKLQNAKDPRPDIFGFGLDYILNQNAYDVLGSFMEKSGEMLPVRVKGLKGGYYFFNCTKTISALDLAGSVWRYSKTRGTKFLSVPSFDAGKICVDSSVFRCAERELPGLFLAQAIEPSESVDFIRIYQQSGLKGLRFKLLWSKGAGVATPEVLFSDDDPFEYQTFDGKPLKFPAK